MNLIPYKKEIMFSLFKKKSAKEKLAIRYKLLMSEAHKLGVSNRKLSDQKVFEANEVMKELEKLI